MGLLVDGKWQNKGYNTEDSGGKFEREASKLRGWITPDGSAGPGGETGFKAESGRYHLYVSLACPWAHRTLIFRQLKQLEKHIDVSVVSPEMLEQGWRFNTATGSTGDRLHQYDFMHQIYTHSKADYSGRVTVPVLWDTESGCIVNNESSEIIRMMNGAFNEITGNKDDYYPESLRSEIDEINELVYNNINNGVYRCGFATRQAAYEEAYDDLFAALDVVESRLEKHRYLVGNEITEADWRLFTTLVRFDPVYHGHFKCNRQKLEEFAQLPNYLRDLYQKPGVAGTVNVAHIQRHYYFSHTTINPNQIVPKGPAFDYTGCHDRDRFH
ncbi:glutathione S-transferase family protein [Ketobacter sp. MCCC 1A13808]|uniref:glutathione S-transferase family protein n=1 Tax=Ketobacter sp. MCCC 1A13808 TaxID=2602738 RepID=UPI000F25610D|nr:glutathione S-transferase family protein [Ketobacter sp. MCCC 1A13808]MVF11960.1 glutathione S-transferase family protein [Ketobacter sp. MCCC 1A13808]RLP52905.1 MAG: glutathione S-transferase family protein [Ketobacter sp.]